MNKWIGTGRLTKDPELRQTTTGKSVCNFTVAVDRKFKAEGQPTADFLNFVAWGKTGEFVSKYFTKGKMIAIEGSVQTRNWTDDNGDKHYITEINVDGVEFCGGKSEDGDSNNTSKKSKKPYKPIETNDDEDISDDDDLPF